MLVGSGVCERGLSIISLSFRFSIELFVENNKKITGLGPASWTRQSLERASVQNQIDTLHYTLCLGSRLLENGTIKR